MESVETKEGNKDDVVGLFRELSDHAQSQIDRAWKAYAWLASALGLIISVGLILLYFIYGNSYETFENKIQERTGIVQEQVEKRIDKELDAKNIRDLIQASATEAAVKQIDVKKIEEFIDNKVEKLVATKVKDLNSQIDFLRSENEKALNNLSTLIDLNFVLSNSSYEIDSLRVLKNIAGGENIKISNIAKKNLNRTLEAIKRDHSRLVSDYWGWKDIDDQYFGLKNTKDWKLEDYIQNYSAIPNDQKVVYVNKFLTDEKKDDSLKFRFSESILTSETRPEIIYTICAFINGKAQLNKDYLFESEVYKVWLKSKI